MQKIKKLQRIGILETNSSSSHSLCISTSGSLCKPGDPCWDVRLSEDGKTVYLPNFRACFNQQAFQTNKCGTKIQYAYAAALKKDIQKQHDITRLIKQVTGAENVVIGWVESYKEEINKVGHDLGMAEVNVPEIDHDSVDDSFEEIFETEETLKNFLFNPNSWLIVEHENFTDYRIKLMASCGLTDLGYYDEEDRAMLSVDIGGEFGRIDIEVNGISEIAPSEIKSNEKISGLMLDKDGNPVYGTKKGLLFGSANVGPLILLKGDDFYLTIFGEPSPHKISKAASRFASTTEIKTEEDVKEHYGDIPYKMFKISMVSDKYGKLL